MFRFLQLWLLVQQGFDAVWPEMLHPPLQHPQPQPHPLLMQRLQPQPHLLLMQRLQLMLVKVQLWNPPQRPLGAPQLPTCA